MSGAVSHAASAYLTYVAIDKKGHPVEVPPLILETDVERRRNREAKARREMRLGERSKKAACRKEPGSCT